MPHSYNELTSLDCCGVEFVISNCSAEYCCCIRYPCCWGGLVDGKPYVDGLNSFAERVLNNVWNAVQKSYPLEVRFGGSILVIFYVLVNLLASVQLLL